MSVAESQRRIARLFFEKVGEMRDFIKTKRMCDLGNIPVGLAKQNLCFLSNAAADYFGCRFARVLFENLVEMVDVYGQSTGVIFCSAQQQLLCRRSDWKLTFQQFYK